MVAGLPGTDCSFLCDFICDFTCDASYERKKATLRTLYVQVVSNSVMFPQILYDIVLYARHLLPVKFFSRVLLLSTMFRATPKCNVDDE